MELEIKGQLAALLLSLLMGAGMALVYDMIRPLRYRVNALGVFILDAVFCVVIFFMAFSFGMKACGGRLGQWELCGMLLGFVAYVHFISDNFYKIFDAWLGLIWRGAGETIKIIKKAVFYIKFYFKKLMKCFII